MDWEEQVREDDLAAQAGDNDKNYEDRISKIRLNDEIDKKFGFERYQEAEERSAYLINIQPSEIIDDQTKTVTAAVDFYFIQEDGSRFKIAYPFRPYFYIACLNDAEYQVATYLTKKYGNMIHVENVWKEDLDLKNHLSGIQRPYLKISFSSMVELGKLKRDLMPLIRKNKSRVKNESTYTAALARHMGGLNNHEALDDLLSQVIDIREHDLPYHMRVAIDEKIFVGKWYAVRGLGPNRIPQIKAPPQEILVPVEPVVMAFDIETTKLPLKFPDRNSDEIMMISYMIDGRGFLIINREIVSSDIESFEYTPKEEFKGEFHVWNEANEKAVIRRFFDHILTVQPNIIVTYNGDFFDWPFVETRADIHGLDMMTEIGFSKDSLKEYKSRNCIHMDAFRWVQRDSYLPVGSQNLKAVAKAKLRYDPVEVDPEKMCTMAREEPQNLANYSVSDAVATYYLYMKYVHPFVFALCTIIPLGPDDVLRKGSGTLCEALLMVEAFHNNIIFPNKYTGGEFDKTTKDGHRIELETYVGGHVEALEAGVFRADIPVRFRLVPTALARLQEEVPATIEKEMIREFGIERKQIVDFEERCAEIQEQFAELLAIPARSENPRIYHLDVGAMYPNIILTNRLQPCAMITEETCMSCCYNTPDAQCKRVMDWEWRGDIIPASKNEYQQIRQQLEAEFFDKPPKPFHLLEKNRREQIEKKRVAAHVTRTEKRQTMICQRENAFYVDTVKAFRDRRYDYKEMLKKAKGELDSTPKDDVAGIKAAQARVVLYESLQLAHKCILNSFYGYVMRKGSRWFSMEMAGIVCYTGANIITEARKLVEQIGKPLELDTDGIWCLIPASFPENVTFQVRNHKRKSVTVSYPAAMLNALVFESFTNHQYHTLQEDKSYKVESTNSIYFEVDGPYQCMVLPASKEEGKKLKKRYAVFNLDGSLAELKGFELKRRGELNIIKYFQNSVFKTFLRGSTLEEVYGSVACDANHWLDILFDKGAEMSDSELFDLISENRSMSRKLDDYGAQKSTSISTAKRLAEFLGAEMVQDAGLACMFVISRYPIGAPVTERAIPVAIYQADPKVRLHYLRKWTKQPGLELEKCEIRELLDWDYYRERLGSCIQKIITIPAALQGVSNPVPRVPHPDWLSNKIKNRVDARKQPKITDIFEKAKQRTQETSDDVVVLGMKRKSMARAEGSEPDDDDDDNVVEKENQNPKKRPAKEKDVEKEPEKLVKKTLVDHGFQEWLRFLKQKWKLQRTQRKTLQSVSGVEKILRDTRLKTAEAGWQLLWLEETREPGYFNLWAAKEGQMRNFALKVDRAITVNYKTPIEGRSTVRRVLPHQQTPFHLYEYKSDETKFSALLDKLNAELCSAHVEGIYESQTPLALRALAHLGAISRTNTPPQSGVYNLESFSMIPLSESPTPYLPQGFLRTIFLYKYSKGNAHIWSVIDESMGEGHVLVSNPGQIDLPNVTRLYETLHEEEVKTNSTVESIRAQIQFKNYVFTSIKECCKEVHKILRIASQATTRPTIIVAVCDEAHRSMVQHVANISLFPFLRLHVVEPSALLNLPGWNRLLPSRIIRHFFNSFVYLQDYADWARYLHIPLCNMPSDPAMFAIDLFYTRHLTWASQTLWATASSRPDLGGKELDDLRLAVDWTPLTKDTATLINKPGFWGDSCIELELGFVAVTALVQRGRLLNAEGADDTVAFDSSAALPAEAVIGVRNTISAYDEGAAVDAAMKILKGMLSDCLREMAVTQNVRANEMLLGLSRWLHTPTALLYDPAITRSVTVLEKKMVLLLCTECERLGAKVIYASANRLILSTGKSSIDKALGFVQLLIESLDKNPLFASIVKQPIKAYRAMLWRDFYNFTGIGSQDVKEIPYEDRTITTKTESRWRLADELSEENSVRDEFYKIINGYIALHLNKSEELGLDADSAVAYRIDVLNKHILNRLQKFVLRLKERGVQGSEMAEILIEAVTTALSCDSGCEQEVDLMKEDLEKLLDNRKYKNQDYASSSVKSIFVSDIYCASCSTSKTIDLGDDATRLSCGECNGALPLEEFDSAVTEKLNALVTAYMLQDQSCPNCKAIRCDTLSPLCQCSRPYENTIKPDEMKSELAIARDICEQEDERVVSAFTRDAQPGTFYAMPLTEISSLYEMTSLLDGLSSTQLVVIDFFAHWCGPCKFIAPVYEQLSNQYLNAKFLKVDVDKARDVMQQYGVRAMPTFVFLKNKIEVERVQGANPDALVAAITKHYSSAPSNPDAANPLERQFLQQFAAVSRSTAEYLDEISKTLALSLVPEEELRTKATIKGTLNHFLLAKLLLKWFKESFFKWTDSPICKKCGTQTDKNGGLQGTPNHEELENGAGRVEIYQCKNCDCEVRFPRYNKPARLLETRNGRCGEFANCFTLIAAAMGFNVRYIYDVTDHVWVELFIPGADRWVHCDPCENIIDQPLLYEKGWGKNLSYVLAFGTDHVYDVTWRYSLDHKKTLKRRNRCREVVLARFIEKLNERYQKNMTPERKTELVKRRIRELVEFLVIGPRKDTSQNLGGRTTGSEEWRRARGELGEQVGCSTNCATTLLTPEQEAERAMAEVKIEPKFVFTPTEEEITNGSFKIEYSVVKDEYKRGTDVKKDFSSWVYEAKNMQRKVEADWKMAYLCRNEGTNDAEIMWSIDLSQVKAKQVKISMKGCEKFESGSVDAMVCSGDMCMIVRKGELIFDDVPQAVVKITVNLSGGEGENAFQHAQLFRSKLDDQAPQLVVEINFK